MRKVTIAIVLALLAMAVLSAGCPRKGSQTNVAIDDTVPATDTVATTDATTPEGETNVNIDVNQGGDTTSTEQTEGDQAASGDKTGDEKAGEEKPAPPVKEDPNVTTVILETSKGNIVLGVHKDWAPLGAAHFLELVNAGYYKDAPWFRVFKAPQPNISVAQCGIAADPKVTAQWQDKTIQDEPVKQGNKRGTVCFGKSGAPNSRSTHIFINLDDNGPALDPQGFACFAEVVEGMDVADKLKETGSDTVDQGRLSAEGITYFKSVVPDGDTILRAYVK